MNSNDDFSIIFYLITKGYIYSFPIVLLIPLYAHFFEKVKKHITSRYFKIFNENLIKIGYRGFDISSSLLHAKYKKQIGFEKFYETITFIFMPISALSVFLGTQIAYLIFLNPLKSELILSSILTQMLLIFFFNIFPTFKILLAYNLFKKNILICNLFKKLLSSDQEKLEVIKFILILKYIKTGKLDYWFDIDKSIYLLTNKKGEKILKDISDEHGPKVLFNSQIYDELVSPLIEFLEQKLPREVTMNISNEHKKKIQNGDIVKWSTDFPFPYPTGEAAMTSVMEYLDFKDIRNLSKKLSH